jgi:hypothetical protein
MRRPLPGAEKINVEASGREVGLHWCGSDWKQAAQRGYAALPIRSYMAGKPIRRIRALPIGHFLRHVQDELAIFLVGLAE